LEYTGEKICGIYDCCVNTKKIKHCGKCEKVPCNKYNGSDPTKTLKENNEDLINQLAQLRTMGHGDDFSSDLRLCGCADSFKTGYSSL
jgi:hypothetical protein